MKKTVAFFLILIISFTAVACAQRKPDYYAGGYGSTDDWQKPDDSSSVVDTLRTPDNTTPTGTDVDNTEGPDITTEKVTQPPSFEGRDFRILCQEQYTYEVFGDENGSDALSYDVWERNLKVEDALDICIKPEKVSGDGKALYNSLHTSVLAREERCEIALPDIKTAGDLFISGILLSWDGYSVYDHDDRFYTNNMNNSISFAGKNYFLITDINVSSIGSTYVMTMNKVLGDELGLTDEVVGLVDSGNFTLDSLVELLADVDNSRAKGLSASFRDLSHMICGSALSFVDYCMWDSLDNWGSGYLFSYYYEYSFDKADRAVKLLMKIGADDGNSVSGTNNGDFKNGNALFSVMTLDAADNIDDTSDFAVIYLPLPKLHSEQNVYATRTAGNYSVTVRDITVTDTDFVSCVTAYMSDASWKINETKLEMLKNNKYNEFIPEILKSRREDLSAALGLREPYFFKPVEQYIANGNDSLVEYSTICDGIIEIMEPELKNIVSNYFDNIPQE